MILDRQKNLTILGSTGSIGRQALEIIDVFEEIYHVVGLSAHSNWKLLADQANHFRPDYLLVTDETVITLKEFKRVLNYEPKEIFMGPDSTVDFAILEESDTVLNSLVGFAGFQPTYHALRAGKKVALANKESLVVGGELIASMIRDQPEMLIPIDSEHSAMLQCLVGEPKDRIEKIIITASGGPFRTWSAKRIANVQVEDALDHPNWSMGAKITVDSSTLINKGLEIIEAYWLFGIPLEQIEPVIHPQSIIHSIIEFVDGSSKAQLGPPDMKVPILYALSYPDRFPLTTDRIDWSKHMELTFEPVDYQRFPCLKLAIDAAKKGGHAPAVLNAANEVAVERFLKREIDYIDIAKIVGHSLDKIHLNTDLTPGSLHEVDLETRSLARRI